MRSFLLIFSLLFFVNVFGQMNFLKEKFELPNIVNETSGLIFYNSKIITHNDSGDSPNLYEIDTISGNIVRTIAINNATNVDWEDITQDDTHIYVADIGNNFGNRQDLKIYKILKSDYLNSNSVNAEVISFSYEDQTDFSSQPYNTNFDAEAIGIFQDNIVIFTKNWANYQTNAYIIPKTIGTYTAQKVSTYNSEGLITGSDFQGDRIMLSAYTSTGVPFLLFVHENRPPGLDFFGGTVYKIDLIGDAYLEQGSQIEAIGYFDYHKCYITREASSFDNGSTTINFPQKLYEFTTDLFGLLSLNDYQLYNLVKIGPNPTSETVSIINENVNEEIEKIYLYDLKGRKLFSTTKKTFNVHSFSNGVHFVHVKFKSGKSVVKKMIIN